MTEQTAHPTSEILSLYHDGEGAKEMLVDVEAHLARCPDCQRELDRLRKLSHVLLSVSEEAAPAQMLEQISARLHGKPQQQAAADTIKSEPPAPSGGTNTPVTSITPDPVPDMRTGASPIPFRWPIKWMGLAALILFAMLAAFVISNRAANERARLDVAKAPAGFVNVPAPEPAQAPVTSEAAASARSKVAKERGSGAKSKEDRSLADLELKAEQVATPFRILGVRPVAEDGTNRAAYCWQVSAGDGDEGAALRELEERIRAWKAGDFDAPAGSFDTQAGGGGAGEGAGPGGQPVAEADLGAQLARLLEPGSAAAKSGKRSAYVKSEQLLALDLSVPREELPALLAFLGAWEVEKAKPAQKLGAPRSAAREESRQATPALESLPPTVELRIVIKAAESADMSTPEKSTEQRK